MATIASTVVEAITETNSQAMVARPIVAIVMAVAAIAVVAVRATMCERGV
jgi:hypothetical protein